MSYLAIDRANQCIDGIKASSLYASGDATMKQLLGEAYCMRAYWYFLLCNYWGDVPLALSASKSGMDLNTPKVNKDTIYSQLIRDLISSEENMQWAEKLNGGIERMNREFALGMIARLSLFRAGYSMQADGTMKRESDYLKYYEIAKKYSQKLIDLKDRPLNSSFSQIFLNECQFSAPVNDEVLYEVGFVAGGGGDVGWCIGLSVSSNTSNNSGGLYGNGGSYVYFPASYYNSFNPKDLRLPTTCSLIAYGNDANSTTYYQTILSPTTINPGKWCRLWLKPAPGNASTKGTGINWPLMRYSDILLMLAEAENALNGPTQIAKDALKRVRNRAFAVADRPELVENYVEALTSSDAFFKAIVNERAWEFGGECMRKFDLVRWNLYGPKIVETKNILTQMGQAGVNNVANDYSNVADALYYKSVDGVIQFYNTPFQRVDAATVPAGYTSIKWSKAFMKDATTVADYINWCWRGYTDNTGVSAVPYLLPIHQDIINASNGVLTNTGYGLTIQ